jgi:hypothetical protein
MSYFKIISILHSGSKGKRGIVRTDGRYPTRINRIVQFDCWNDIKIGQPLVMNYVKDEDGNDYMGFGLITSIVKDWDFIYDGVIKIETLNSIYELEEINEV